MAAKPKAKNSNKKTKKLKVLKKKSGYLREIVVRYRKKKIATSSPVGRKIEGAKHVVDLFLDLQNEAKEKLIVVSLDAKLKILCFEVVAVGSSTSVYARPAEILRAPILTNAYGIIIVHNHPAGDPEPSKDDKAFTLQFTFHAKGLGFNVIDHIIIGDEGYFSFAEQGLIEGSKTEK